MTKKYMVTNPFVDKTTNKVVLPGAEYEADDERAKRLQAADVIGAEVTPVAPVASENQVDDVIAAASESNLEGDNSAQEKVASETKSAKGRKAADANVNTAEQG